MLYFWRVGACYGTRFVLGDPVDQPVVARAAFDRLVFCNQPSLLGRHLFRLFLPLEKAAGARQPQMYVYDLYNHGLAAHAFPSQGRGAR